MKHEPYSNREINILSTLDTTRGELYAAQRERDVYRKAKQENDERFMRERDEARAERDALRAEVERLRGERDRTQEYADNVHRLGQKALDDARDRAVVAEAEVERLREALRDVEWGGTHVHEEGEEWPACPSCRELREDGKHLRGCSLAAALSSAPPAKPSALDAAAEAWRGLSEEERESTYIWFTNLRGMTSVRAALALLRAAAVKP